MSDEVTTAKALLEREGFVVLREKSYRQAQERQRVAEALLRAAEEAAEGTRAWARNCLDSERYLRDRCEFLYGQAMARGATAEDLVGLRTTSPVTV